MLPAVKRIVADVRKQGDRALLRYAAQFDGLARRSALCASSQQEMAAAWEAIDPALRQALIHGRRADSRLCQRATASLVER